MSLFILVPQVSVNEDEVTLVEWLKPDRSQVHRGEAVCNVETTKSVVEVCSAFDGYIRHLVEVGQRIITKRPLAVVTATANEEIGPYLTSSTEQRSIERRWTKKAALVAKQLGVDLEELAKKYPDRTITEPDIRAAVKNEMPAGDLMDDVHQEGRAERVLLLYGAAGGGMIALDSLSRIPHQRAEGILDNNPKSHGRTVMGVPVLGPLDMAESLWAANACDAMINTFVDPIEERCRTFERLRAIGVRFANIVDPTADIRSNVKLGVGNLIQPHCYIGAGSTIGDNNFFASHVCIEHHNEIGSHCTFGPRVATSGRVRVGSTVKVGIGVCFEPYISIGDQAIIASGCCITNDIPPRSSVKSQQNHVVRTQE